MAPGTALCRAPDAPSYISVQTFLPRVTFKQQPEFFFC